MRIAATCVLLVLAAASCDDDCNGSPAEVDRSGRPSPSVPTAERTMEASTRSTPSWIREQEATRIPTYLARREGTLAQLFHRAEAAQKGFSLGEPGLWLCQVRLLVPESGAEGLVPFSDPDILLKGSIGGRPLLGLGTNDLMSATVPLAWVRARPGEALAFQVYDRDLVSDDDLVASVAGKLEGLPVELKAPRAAVACRGVPEALWAATVEELYDDFERARAIADAAKRASGAIEEGYPMLQIRDMKGALRLIGELGGNQHPYVGAGDRAMVATLARLASEFPNAPPATSAL